MDSLGFFIFEIVALVIPQSINFFFQGKVVVEGSVTNYSTIERSACVFSCSLMLSNPQEYY